MFDDSSVHRSIEINKVDPKSAGQLAAFLRRSFIEAYQGVHTAANLNTYCSQQYTQAQQQKVLDSPKYEVYFAKRSTKNVGVLVLNHRRCPLKPDLQAIELKQLYLLSSEYKTGLGRLLLEFSFQQSIELGNGWMWLCVSDLNHRAQRFYEKMGFERIGKGETLEVGTDQLPSSIMLRRLKSEEC